MKTTENAYAKINLFLDVNSKRQDGYHGITTVMQEISLCDSLTVTVDREASERKITVVTDSPELSLAPTDNLAYRAAQRFLQRINRDANIGISLEKKIPIAAGLGGGSSDAAATLRALNRLFDTPLSDGELSALAAELGSDVPFCLHGGTALCRGRGEIVTPLEFDADIRILIAKSSDEIKTPRAYSALDKKYSDFTAERAAAEPYFCELKEYISGKRGKIPELYNIFESVIFDECENARKIKEDMLSFGACAALLSGSGPSVFGIFDSDSALLGAKAEFDKKGIKTFSVHTK